MDMHGVLDLKIRNILKFQRQMGICPLGKNGLLAKTILNNRYGAKEAILIDNMVSEINPNCFSIENAQNNVENMVVLLTAQNRDVNEQLEMGLIEKGFDVDNIFKPSVFKTLDKEYLLNIRRLISPRKTRGYQYIRIGSENDGGYVLIDNFSKIKAAYSFGIGNDVSWEKHLADKTWRGGIKLFMYDHTIDSLPEDDERFHFFRCGISSDDRIEGNLLSISAILKVNGHLHEDNLILKMDVEGAEWDFLNSVDSDLLMNFDQIVIELHDILDRKNREKIVKGLEKLSQTHQAVWIHGNNFDIAERTDDICVPNMLEVTFVRKGSYLFEEDSTLEFPLDMDAPNWGELADIRLGRW